MSGYNTKDISKNWAYEVTFIAPLSGKDRKMTIACFSYQEALDEARKVLPERTKLTGIRRIE